MKKVLPIVEGDSEIRAVPTLIRRILHRNNLFDVKVMHPQQSGNYLAVKKNLIRNIKMAMKEKACIFWVFDCDDECPIEAVRELQTLSAAEYKPYPIEFALMVKEFESLFLADPDNTKMRLGIGSDITFPSNPESIRGVKEWLSKNMPPGLIYKPTIHQDALSAIIDLDVLRERSPSFQHFERALLRLIN